MYLDHLVYRNRSHSSSNFELSALPSIHLCVWLLENAVIHLWLFDLKSLFLSSKGNSPRKPFIVHNSKNINKTNNVTALHNFFIYEKNNDNFKDTEILRDTVQINTKVQTGPIQCFVWSTAGADVASTGAARESGNSVSKDASSNILRLIQLVISVGSLGSHSSINRGNFSI